MSIFQCLGFMFLGGLIVWLFDRYAWRKYYEGLRTGAGKQETQTQGYRHRLSN